MKRVGYIKDHLDQKVHESKNNKVDEKNGQSSIRRANLELLSICPFTLPIVRRAPGKSLDEQFSQRCPELVPTLTDTVARLVEPDEDPAQWLLSQAERTFHFGRLKTVEKQDSRVSSHAGLYTRSEYQMAGPWATHQRLGTEGECAPSVLALSASRRHQTVNIQLVVIDRHR